MLVTFHPLLDGLALGKELSPIWQHGVNNFGYSDFIIGDSQLNAI